MKKIWIFVRILTGVLCALAAPLWILLAWQSENFARYWVYMVAPVLGLILLSLWYAAMGPGTWKVRLKYFTFFVVAMIAAGVVFRMLTRYEGSLSGTSLPHFVWKWAPAVDDGIASAEPVSKEVEQLKKVDGIVDSPQFFGPGRDATWRETIASLDWDTHPPEEMWRQPIGAGWSSFAVVGRRAVTQEQRREEELVTCYDLVSGDLLWVHSDQARLEAKMGGLGPRATPTIVDSKVYAFGGTGILNCLDLTTGKVIWSQDIEERMKGHFPDWGKSTSPLVTANLVVVSGAEGAGPTLLAFDAGTGKEVWVYEGKGASYSTPRMLKMDGVEQLVSVNGVSVTGHELESGEVLWRYNWPGRQPKVGQPMLVDDDKLLVTASYGAGSFLLQISQQAEKWSVTEVWKSKRLKTKFSSAVIRDGYAYGLDEGIMACIDLNTGDRVWKGGRYRYGQQLLIGDHLLVQGERGEVAVVKAVPDEFRETARIQALNHMTWNAPTLAGRYLLVRNDREAVCYRLAP